MDEPTEPQPVVPGDPSGDLPLPPPIGARSTVHPWEEPPILPTASMFHAAPPTPTRGRHARRRPAGLLSVAAAASVLLVGGSAVTMLTVAASSPGHAPAGAATGGTRVLGGQSQVAAAPSPSDSGGVAAGLQPARYAQTRGASPSTRLHGPRSTFGASTSAGSGSTAMQSAHGVLPSSGTSPSALGGSAGPSGSTTPSSGTGGWAHIPWAVPNASHSPVVLPTRRPSVVPLVPPGSVSAEPPASVPTVSSTDEPAPSPATKPTRWAPRPSHPHPHPVPVPSYSEPAPEPSQSELAPEPSQSESSAGEPSESESSESESSDSGPSESESAPSPVVRVPAPSHRNSGLHRAVGHAIDPPGLAVGHARTPASQDMVTPANPLPAASE